MSLAYPRGRPRGLHACRCAGDAGAAGALADAVAGRSADSGVAAIRLARTYGNAAEALAASKSAANLRGAGLGEDVSWCAQESVLDVVPRYRGMVEYAAEVTL